MLICLLRVYMCLFWISGFVLAVIFLSMQYVSHWKYQQ